MSDIRVTLPLTPGISVAKANSIMAHVEDELSKSGMPDQVFPMFKKYGAFNRPEAENIILIALASFYRHVGNSPAAVQVFDDYTSGMDMLCHALVYEHLDEETRIALIKAVKDALITPSKFAAFLKTLDVDSANYWPKVYQEIGIPLPSSEQSPRQDPAQTGTAIISDKIYSFPLSGLRISTIESKAFKCRVNTAKEGLFKKQSLWIHDDTDSNHPVAVGKLVYPTHFTPQSRLKVHETVLLGIIAAHDEQGCATLRECVQWVFERLGNQGFGSGVLL
jgi:hypothetical protein